MVDVAIIVASIGYGEGDGLKISGEVFAKGLSALPSWEVTVQWNALPATINTAIAAAAKATVEAKGEVVGPLDKMSLFSTIGL